MAAGCMTRVLAVLLVIGVAVTLTAPGAHVAATALHAWRAARIACRAIAARAYVVFQIVFLPAHPSQSDLVGARPVWDAGGLLGAMQC